MLRIFTAAALLALSVTAAQAEDPATASQSVTYGDLNLSHASDARILAARLEAAAKTVCLQTGNDRDLQGCISYAVTTAISSIESQLDENVRVQLNGRERLANANP